MGKKGGLMNPDYPIYIVSKGRWESRLTSKALEEMGVSYKIVIEPQEYSDYAAVINPTKILILPTSYLDDYDTCDNLGRNKSVGPGAARNFVWDHAIATGSKRHWVMDDNLDAFHRMNRNIKAEVLSGTIFKIAEQFVDRYENVPLAGFNYYSFCKTMDAVPPMILNTRIYSCLLIENAAPYRWRGRYNEDTDLSLRVLKDGYCTIQFNAFLQGKVTTQRMKGGNTKEFYREEGTMAKSQMLVDLHPDVAKVVWRFNRWHHHVDYRQFKHTRLKKREGLSIPDRVNNYGMKLVDYPEWREGL
jgi:hypothetical protein